ncbi:MAG: hypothetical protein ACXADB_05320 [Candidatus Hermodarchaeia archaeon]|jgi:hypothetical protein
MVEQIQTFASAPENQAILKAIFDDTIRFENGEIVQFNVPSFYLDLTNWPEDNELHGLFWFATSDIIRNEDFMLLRLWFVPIISPENPEIIGNLFSADARNDLAPGKFDFSVGQMALLRSESNWFHVQAQLIYVAGEPPDAVNQMRVQLKFNGKTF